MKAGIALLTSFLVSTAAAAAQTEPAASAAAAQRACEKINARKATHFLIFNPKGYQTYYVRSLCLQDAAIEFRDATFCADVRERKSLVSDGSRVSAQACRTLVADAKDKDRAQALELAQEGFHRMTDLQILRNGNGRGYDILFATSGGRSGAYEFTVTFSGTGAGDATLINRSLPFASEPSERRLYVEPERLDAALQEGWRRVPVSVTAQLVYVPSSMNRQAVALIDPILMTSSQARMHVFENLPPWRAEKP